MNIERLVRTGQLHLGLKPSGVQHVESFVARAVRSLTNTESVDGGLAPRHQAGTEFLNLLIGALTLGLMLSILALGVYVSFRIFNIPDITAEGSITLGGAVAAMLIILGLGPIPATIIAALAGVVAGVGTGVMATKFKIQPLLAGILSMTALYSINLRVMGRSNLPLINENTLATYAEQLGGVVFGGRTVLEIAGWTVGMRDMSDVTRILFAGGTRGHAPLYGFLEPSWAPPCVHPGTTPR